MKRGVTNNYTKALVVTLKLVGDDDLYNRFAWFLQEFRGKMRSGEKIVQIDCPKLLLEQPDSVEKDTKVE
jgi:hypothetical protein